MGATKDQQFVKVPDDLERREWVLLEWLVGEGEQARSGEPLAVVLASSGSVVISSPYDGTVLEHWIGEGARVEAGQRLALLEVLRDRL